MHIRFSPVQQQKMQTLNEKSGSNRGSEPDLCITSYDSRPRPLPPSHHPHLIIGILSCAVFLRVSRKWDLVEWITIM